MWCGVVLARIGMNLIIRIFFLEFAGETEFNFLMFYQNDPGGGVSGRDREVLCDIVIFHRLHGTRIVSAVSTEPFFFSRLFVVFS